MEKETAILSNSLVMRDVITLSNNCTNDFKGFMKSGLERAAQPKEVLKSYCLVSKLGCKALRQIIKES